MHCPPSRRPGHCFGDGSRPAHARWAVVTGAGVNSDTMREAVDCGLDTIITGEGRTGARSTRQRRDSSSYTQGTTPPRPPGVRALAEWLATRAGVPWSFVAAPTGL